jgi:dTDP-4-dehydrorhamnose 3,5-epimerase
VFEPRVLGDERGYFFESYNQRDFDEAVGRQIRFVQHNHSRSASNVLRELATINDGTRDGPQARGGK